MILHGGECLSNLEELLVVHEIRVWLNLRLVRGKLHRILFFVVKDLFSRSPRDDDGVTKGLRFDKPENLATPFVLVTFRLCLSLTGRYKEMRFCEASTPYCRFIKMVESLALVFLL